MALAIIFTIGTKAGDTGFGLGRRAMAASESDISISDLRSLVRSVALRPPSTFAAEGDRPVIGSPDRFEADVVMERANQCGPLGWSGRMVLTVETQGGSNRLVCEAGGRKAVLFELGASTASMTYSRDGKVWVQNYTNAPADGQDATEGRSETVWVCLSSPVFGDVVEAATSGSPDPWLRINRDL